jgi:hypothetical protein
MKEGLTRIWHWLTSIRVILVLGASPFYPPHFPEGPLIYSGSRAISADSQNRAKLAD